MYAIWYICIENRFVKQHHFVALFVNRIACVTVVFAVSTIASGNKICKENKLLLFFPVTRYVIAVTMV